MRYLAILVVLTGCVDPASRSPEPQPPAAAPTPTRSAATGVGAEAREALALSAAARLAATVDSARAPAGLVASDFSVEASLDEYAVALDDIADNGAAAQITATGRSLHVIAAGPTYRAAVFVKPEAGRAAFSELHGDDLASAVGKALASWSPTEHPDGGAFLFVTVPAMHLSFVGHRVGGELTLASLSDRSDLGLLAGVQQPARSVFASLAGEAKRAAAQANSQLAARR